jgi:hypothetical protein
MSNSFVVQSAVSFAPLDFTNVYGFPNTVPDIKIWEDVLPKFGGYAYNNPTQHLFEFHKLMDELNIHHEDVLISCLCFRWKEMLDSSINIYPILVFLR